MADMAHFVGDDAGNLVRALGLLQQPVEQINSAARKRERIGYRRRQHLGLQRHVHMAGLTQRFDKLGESGVAFRIGAGRAAEYRPDLIVGHAAETPFKRKRDQRRQALGGERHAEDDDQHDRGDGGERPGDDAAGLPAAAAFGLERTGARADFHLRRRVGHLEPRQRQGGYAFEAQRALARHRQRAGRRRAMRRARRRLRRARELDRSEAPPRAGDW